MRVRIATARDVQGTDTDEPLLCAALAALGVTVAVAPWDDPRPWGEALPTVIRSTWNYLHHPEAFAAWAQRVGASTTLHNDAGTVTWNLHKGYLVDLARRGLPVVPTALVRRGEAFSLAALPSTTGWVVKPAVSAGSFATRRFEATDVTRGQAFLAELAAQRDVLVQPYLPSVTDHGERCLIVLDGVVSHAVRKEPCFEGDPVGVFAPVAVAPEEAALATAVLRTLPQMPLYGRVDLARDEEGALRLMELELIEPFLFLAGAEGACERFARAIASRL